MIVKDLIETCNIDCVVFFGEDGRNLENVSIDSILFDEILKMSIDDVTKKIVVVLSSQKKITLLEYFKAVTSGSQYEDIAHIMSNRIYNCDNCPLFLKCERETTMSCSEVFKKYVILD